MRVLFGSILAVDDAALLLVAGVASASLLVLALVWRPLLVECFDPNFLRAVGGRGALHHQLFLVLLVANLVAGFQALGTLMAVGLLMLPAIAARCWAHGVGRLSVVAFGIATACGWGGLLLSYHFGLPSGPAIVLLAGLVYLVSLAVGPRDSLRARFVTAHRHRAA
jgi:zinc/manganese transport system permease protein